MTKKEKIQALKEVLRIVKSGYFGRDKWHDGLCGVITGCYWDEKINSRQRMYLENKINRLPKIKRGDSAYYVWQYGIKAPRIKWLREQIKKLETK